jgi:hypothetical protein
MTGVSRKPIIGGLPINNLLWRKEYRDRIGDACVDAHHYRGE